MNKLFVLVVLLVVVLCAAFFWFLDGDLAEGIEEVEITSEEIDSLNEVSRYSLSPKMGRKTLPQIISTAPILSQFEFANDPTLTVDNSTLIQVIDDKTEAAIPNAVVTILSKREYEQLGGKLKVKEDPFAFFSQHGTHFQTDKNGKVRVPDISEDPMVAGMTAHRIGFGGFLAPMRLVLQVRLSPSIDVTARVVDSRGRPLPEAKVQLIVSYNGGMNGRETWTRPLFFGATNNDGIARIRIPENLLRLSFKHRPNAQFRLGVSGFLEAANTVAFDIDNPPKGVVELKLSEFGGLEVTIQNLDGSRCRNPLNVYLSVHKAGEKLASFFAVQRAIASQETTTGQVIWPRLPCGLQYNVTLKGEMIRNKPETRILDGPKTSGSVARQTIRFTWAPPVLRGQLLTPDGKFLANQTLRLQMAIAWATVGGNKNRSRTTSLDYYSTTTDQEGRFEVDLQSYAVGSRVFERHLTINLAGMNGSDLFFKRVLIPQGTNQEDVELGTVTLEKVELLASGRVVDVHGDPVYRAGFSGRFKGQGGREEPGLLATQLYRLRTGRDGAFTIYGSFGSRFLSLSSFADEFLKSQVVVEKPNPDLVLTLQRPASLRGQLIFSNGLSTAGVMARLLAIREKKAGPIEVKVAKDGTFVAKDLRPGNYRLTVTPHKSQSDLLLDMPLTLSDGQDLDLSDVRIKFDGARLELVTIVPTKIKIGMLISVREPGTTKEVTRFVLTKRKETLFIPIPACDLHLTTAGYRQTVMKGVTSGVVELRMNPGIPVSFQFVNSGELPKGYEVNFFVDPNLGTGPFWLRNIGPRRTVPFHSPGRFRMSAQIAHVGNRRKTQNIALSPQFINVLDKTDPQLFKLSLSLDDVEDALERMKR